MLEWIRRRSDESEDYRAAWTAKGLSESLISREETRRLRRVSERQKHEQDGVQEAHTLQAIEFNSAWNANMAEFENQALELEEQIKERQLAEFEAFHARLSEQAPRTYKYSVELLRLRKSIGALAKQGEYEKAHKVSVKAEELERRERTALDHEHEVQVAAKELRLRQRQQLQLEALRRRIQRGRQEHKEHWLQGAQARVSHSFPSSHAHIPSSPCMTRPPPPPLPQRLMKSQRNTISDLRNKQALENSSRTDTAVKMDIAISRVGAHARRAKCNFSDARARVDTRRQKGTGIKR